MKGDFFRYTFDFKFVLIFRYKAEASLEDREMDSQRSCESYEKALEISTKYLSPADSIHLGLVLNFSVLKFEILHERKNAIDLASKHFSGGLEQIDALSENGYKDSTIVLQLLRDNVSLWQSRDESDSEDEDNLDDQIIVKKENTEIQLLPTLEKKHLN